jgi:AcrR family transcriptional regulator
MPTLGGQMPTRQALPAPPAPNQTSTVPTGVPIRDIRQQLFDAAERVLLRDGPDALTSRAVTTEAGVAKGILHRHFPDFDGFLAALVLTHLDRLDACSTDLRATAGTATVTDNLTRALTDALEPAALRVISLVCSRHALLARLRLTTPRGIPLLTETSTMVAAYLTAERGLGRIALDADVDTLAVILVGAAHLVAAGSDEDPPDPDELREVVAASIDSALRAPPRRATRVENQDSTAF